MSHLSFFLCSLCSISSFSETTQEIIEHDTYMFLRSMCIKPLNFGRFQCEMFPPQPSLRTLVTLLSRLLTDLWRRAGNPVASLGIHDSVEKQCESRLNFFLLREPELALVLGPATSSTFWSWSADVVSPPMEINSSLATGLFRRRRVWRKDGSAGATSFLAAVDAVGIISGSWSAWALLVEGSGRKGWDALISSSTMFGGHSRLSLSSTGQPRAIWKAWHVLLRSRSARALCSWLRNSTWATAYVSSATSKEQY